MLGCGAEYRDEFHKVTPYETWLKGFNVGHQIRIVGVPTEKGGRFAINLKCGQEYYYHFNVRFDEKEVVRNTTVNGKWQKEERKAEGFPFEVGRYVTIDLIASDIKIVANVDGEYHSTFQYRDDPKSINFLEITGDIKLHNVHIVDQC
uniref:Galectin n=1 Tax=Syphacia muris TaxID=451379 RepID=A0A0N5AJH4_9BILA